MATLVLLTVLAGCSSSGGGGTTVVGDKPDLKSGKGGILGLLVDDVYRPIPNVQVLLLPPGLLTTTDSRGQFSFVNLDPGTFTLKLDAPKHEAAPRAVDVAADQFTEIEFNARRIVSDNGRVITTFYSVFVPCSVSIVEETDGLDCTFDQSHETDRSAFESDYSPYGKNVTYLVTEMKSSQKASPTSGAYKVVVRDAANGGQDPYYTSGFVTDTDYLKLTMHIGNVSADDAEPGRNQMWTNDRKLQTAFFPQGGFKSETQLVLDTQCTVSKLCFESRGLGPQVGVKATFIQSAFIGEPLDPIEDYHTMGPS
jgi:hypothetical protein